MSFNIGENSSKFVSVSNVKMIYSFSEKVLFADLRTSRKTGNPKVNKESGEIITDEKGNPVPERAYSHWEGRFVGNALEPAKALRNGQAINIVNGWIEKETWKDEKGNHREKAVAVITDFVPTDFVEDGDDDGNSSMSDAIRALNGDVPR